MFINSENDPSIKARESYNLHKLKSNNFNKIDVIIVGDQDEIDDQNIDGLVDDDASANNFKI